MGKKGKADKKSKKSKDSKPSLSKEPKIPQIDEELFKVFTEHLQDVFRFWNGDVYVGHIAVTLDGKITREGKGKYFTDDGCVFNGRWENDVLVEAEKVSYPDGSWYIGPLEEWGYAGPGRYNIPSLGTMECSFLQRRPHGLISLTDNTGNKWQGHAENNSVILLPRNHFFDSEDALLQTRLLGLETGSINDTSKGTLHNSQINS